MNKSRKVGPTQKKVIGDVIQAKSITSENNGDDNEPMNEKVDRIGEGFRLNEEENLAQDSSLLSHRGDTQDEIPADSDLCELSFAGTPAKDNDSPIDPAMYKDELNEIDTTWLNLIYDIVGCKKDASKSVDDVKKWERKDRVPVHVQKSLMKVQEITKEQHRVLFAKVKKDAAEEMRNMVHQLATYEKLLQEKEGGHAKVCETFSQELSVKNKQIEELHKEIEELNEDLDEVDAKLEQKENEYRETLATIMKEHELNCEKLKMVKEQYEEISQKLEYIQMREENLRPADIQMLLNKLRGKVTLQELCAVESLVQKIEGLEAKMIAGREAADLVKEKEKDLREWEEELRLRETIHYEQNKVVKFREQLVNAVVKNKDLRSRLEQGFSDVQAKKEKEARKKNDAPGPSKVKKPVQKTKP